MSAEANMPVSSTSAGRFAFPLFTLLEGVEKLPGMTPAGAQIGGGHARAQFASVLRLDRLFDVFFESYWCRYAAFREVALTGVLSGKARIEIWRRDALTGQEEAITSRDFEGDGQSIVLPVILRAPCDDTDAHYLIAVLHMAGGAELSALSWCAATPPIRQVRLAGVICTFDREDMLADNLTRFAAAAPFLHRMFVINQGAPGLQSRISCGARSRTPFTFIDQPNFGGAGGFTRGIIESMDDPEISHILLMDDDIDARPELLARIATILAYASEQDCIGGAMLDLHQPTNLSICGDRLHPTRPAIIHVAPEDGCADMTTEAGRDFVARNHRSDFNGWWCFAFPVEAVRRFGLPLPLFIRGDDVEFGFRLSRAGFKTISWPGVAVWHMPFHLKVQPWQAFYDRRNMLYLNQLHALHSRRRMARSAWGSFSNALKRRDFLRARAILEGIEAYNEGPFRLATWRGRDHLALRRRLQLRDVADGPAGSRQWRNWKRLVALLARALPVMAALRWRRRDADADTIARFCRPQFWREYLEMGGPEAAKRDKGLASR